MSLQTLISSSLSKIKSKLFPMPTKFLGGAPLVFPSIPSSENSGKTPLDLAQDSLLQPFKKNATHLGIPDDITHLETYRNWLELQWCDDHLDFKLADPQWQKVQSQAQRIWDLIEPLRDWGMDCSFALVGGCLRDWWLGFPVKDVDILLSLDPHLKYGHPSVFQKALQWGKDCGIDVEFQMAWEKRWNDSKIFSESSENNYYYHDHHAFVLLLEWIVKGQTARNAQLQSSFFMSPPLRQKNYNMGPELEAVIKVQSPSFHFDTDILISFLSHANYVTHFDFEFCKIAWVTHTPHQSIAPCFDFTTNKTNAHDLRQSIRHQLDWTPGFAWSSIEKTIYLDLSPLHVKHMNRNAKRALAFQSKYPWPLQTSIPCSPIDEAKKASFENHLLEFTLQSSTPENLKNQDPEKSTPTDLSTKKPMRL